MKKRKKTRRRLSDNGNITLGARGRKRKKSRKGRRLGASMPIIGELSLKNPLLGGAAGGAAARLLMGLIPDDLLNGVTTPAAVPAPAPGAAAPAAIQAGLNKAAPYIKGGILALAAFLLRKNQPAVAAGIMGAATELTMGKLGMLGEGMQQTLYADPNLLSDTVLLEDVTIQDNMLLSSNRKSPYPGYSPLYDNMLLSDHPGSY